MKILVDYVDLGNIIMDQEGNVFIVNEFEGQDFIVVFTPKSILDVKLPKVSYSRGYMVKLLGYTDSLRIDQSSSEVTHWSTKVR